jgi:IPT/TIG domain
MNDYTAYHSPAGVVTFRTAGRCVRGEPVMSSPTAPGKVERWIPGGVYLGIAGHSAPTDELVTVFPSGAVHSGLADGDIAAGELVEVSGTVGRQVAVATARARAAAGVVGTALSTALDGAVVFWVQRAPARGAAPIPPPDPPAPTNIIPNTGPAGGGTGVTILGQQLATATGVTIGGQPLGSPSFGSAITGTTPPGTAGPADVAVTGPGGTGTLPNGFTYTPPPPPNPTGINPASGTPAGGMGVQITGTGFLGVTEVRFGVAPATLLTVDDDTSIHCATPAGTPGAVVDVMLDSPRGPGTLQNGFTYLTVAAPTGIAPASGPAAGGQPVTISGAGFTGSANVLFGVTAAPNRVVVNDTTITCDTPAHAAGLVNVIVVKSGGNGTLPNGYTFLPPPVLTEVRPASGSAVGDEPVQLIGSGFTDPIAVRFGAADSAQTVVISPTEAACTTPAGTPGDTVAVTVTTAGGPYTLADAFTYDAPAAETPEAAPARARTRAAPKTRTQQPRPKAR